MKGKLVVIEGLDSSGKQTQAKLAVNAIRELGYPVKEVAFPDYESDSSALVKMYLAGEFGDKADDVNPYAASSFYAVDRYASYKKNWEQFYKAGGIIFADRYTTSNMIHQASKINNTRIKNLYLDWLYDYEYKLLGIPMPDLVIFLDMPPEYSRALMAKRPNKITGEMQKDLHEKDADHLDKSYVNALYVAKKYEWKKVFCVDDGQLRTIEDIHEEIVGLLKSEKIIK